MSVKNQPKYQVVFKDSFIILYMNVHYDHNSEIRVRLQLVSDK